MPESLSFANESVTVPLDHLRYLQAGGEKDFIARDEFGIVEFSLGEEPVRILEFEDYGLELPHIGGLKVCGDEILLIETDQDPKLWRFQRAKK